MQSQKTKELPTTGEQIRALRNLAGLTQDEVAERSGGLIDRSGVSRLESGAEKGRSERHHRVIINAFGLTFEEVTALFRARMTPERAWEIAKERKGLPTGGASGLARCLDYHGPKWPAPVVAAARAVELTPDADPRPEDWPAILDDIDRRLRGSKILQLAAVVAARSPTPAGLSDSALEGFGQGVRDVQRGTSERRRAGKNGNKP